MSEVCEICGVGVTSWSARYKHKVTHCNKCLDTEKADAYIQSKLSEMGEENDNEREHGYFPETAPASLPALFNFLAWFSLLACALLSFKLLPPGYSIPVIAYVPSFTWGAIGVVQYAIFLAISKVLVYLEQIVINTSEAKK